MLRVACEHRRVFEFDPARSALLAIDFQRDFLSPQGYSARSGEDVSVLARILPAARACLDHARRLGMLVIHTREGHRPDLSDLSEAKQARSSAAGAPIGAPGPLGRLLVRGEHGHDLVDSMQPLPGEPVVDKPGFGAFHATDLQTLLDRRRVSHLLLMGVTTQCCVFSTLREAVDRGYWCLTLRDACATFDPVLQAATFAMIASEDHLFGWIADSAALLAAGGPGQ